MDINDLSQVSCQIGGLIGKNNWKCTTVVTLSFAEIGEYMHARADLMRSLDPVMGRPRAMPDGYGEELDVYGVTFRMRCTKVRRHQASRDGPDVPMTDVEMVRSGQIISRNLGDWMK